MLFGVLFNEVRSALLALKCEIAAKHVVAAGRRLIGLLCKTNFNPAQSRNPAGEAGGSRWTDDGGWGVILTGARGRTAIRVRVDRQSEATPGQAARLAVADAWARDAASRPGRCVLLQYACIGREVPRQDWFSNGLRQWVRTLHDDPMPVGLRQRLATHRGLKPRERTRAARYKRSSC